MYALHIQYIGIFLKMRFRNGLAPFIFNTVEKPKVTEDPDRHRLPSLSFLSWILHAAGC